MAPGIDGGRTPTDLESQVSGWLELLDRQLPGRVSGCYLVGSVAVDDFSPHVSNIDVVVCADRAWGDDERRAVEGTVRQLKRRGRPAHVDLVTYDELERPGGRPDPYTRDLLYDAPALRGRARPPAAILDGEIEAWAVASMTDRLVPWAAAARRVPTRGWTKRVLTPPLLDTCRLYAAARGHVLSKSQAADLVLSEAPRASGRRRILGDAIAVRQGASSSNYWGPVERKHDALRLVDELISGATGATINAARRPAG